MHDLFVSLMITVPLLLLHLVIVFCNHHVYLVCSCPSLTISGLSQNLGLTESCSRSCQAQSLEVGD
jgi:hypothetical protein